MLKAYMMIEKINIRNSPFDLENLIKWKVVQGGMIQNRNCVDAVQNGVEV